MVQVYNDLRGAGVQLDLASYRMLMDAAIEVSCPVTGLSVWGADCGAQQTVKV